VPSAPSALLFQVCALRVFVFLLTVALELEPNQGHAQEFDGGSELHGGHMKDIRHLHDTT
jgi:hypothetical protein